MQVKINSQEGDLLFNAVNEKGFEFNFSGGEKGVRPMEAVLMSAGVCSAIDVENFLLKMRQPLKNIGLKMNAERSESIPRVFTKINYHFTLYGDLNKEKVEKALDMSLKKYCSVSKMLEKTAEINYHYDIVPE